MEQSRAVHCSLRFGSARGTGFLRKPGPDKGRRRRIRYRTFVVRAVAQQSDLTVEVERRDCLGAIAVFSNVIELDG